MSKSKNDSTHLVLCDWQNQAAYEYLRYAPKVVWAWELLRRHPRYVEEWVEYEGRMKLAKAKFGKKWYGSAIMHNYTPKMMAKDNYDKNAWRNRVLKAGNFEIEPLEIHCASVFFKWGLTEPIAPNQTFSENVKFAANNQYPQQIQFHHQFDDLVIEHHIIDINKQVVSGLFATRPDIAVIAFDLKYPLENQIKKANSILSNLAKEAKVAGVSKQDGNKVSAAAFIRHLRMLDALRQEPKTKMTTIIKFLGYVHPEYNENPDKGGKTPHAVANEWKQQAFQALKDYKKFLE